MDDNDPDMAYLWDMLQAAQDVVEIMTGKDKTAWSLEKITRLAVERSIEISGEAARHVSASFRAQHPEIPWRQIIGQRNILAHEYGQIDYDRLFETATRAIPHLIGLLKPLVPPLEDGG